ncbi:MAG TPA: GTP-binding protein [Polyangiales bacterium]
MASVAASENAESGQGAGAGALPIHVLTGFLGSGKTTLLNRALKTVRFGDAAVLINEFGEIAIDHLLVRETREELVLLASGCVCCTLRNDLIEALGALLDQRARGEVPRFSRLLLETTGLADPAAIIQTLVSHAALRDRVYLDGILCTVDAQLGARTLAAQAIARRQVAVADRLLLTKRDRVDAAAVAGLEEQLARLNPRAERVWVTPEADAGALLAGAGHLDTRDVLWIAPRASVVRGPGAAPPRAEDHLADVGQLAVTLPEPVDFRRFSLWVSLITQMWAERLLRLKAVVSARGESGPIAIQAVQHVVYPPLDLPPIEELGGKTHVVLLIEKLTAKERSEITASLLELAA